MYQSLWGGFPWFNVHKHRQGAYFSWCSEFVTRPIERANMAQGLFWWVWRRAGAHTRPAWLKIPSAPSAFPLLWAPQVLGNKPNPPKGVKAWGDGSLRPEEIFSCLDTLGQIRAATSTAGRSATQQLEKRSVTTAAADPYQLSSWLIYSLSESPTTC